VTQELLSGISNVSQFNKLKEVLSAFEDIPLESKHFIKAAEMKNPAAELQAARNALAIRFSNICRKNGIQGSTIDFLICAVANIQNLIIFTTDKDFENYKKYLPIKLLQLKALHCRFSIYCLEPYRLAWI